MAQTVIFYRTATNADHDVVVALLNDLVTELGPENADQLRPRLATDISLALRSPQVCIFLAEDAGATMALGRVDILVSDPIFRLRQDIRCGYVDQMYVRPAYRQRGVGHELLRYCEEWVRNQGVSHVLLHAAPKALRFYERHGYAANNEYFKRL